MRHDQQHVGLESIIRLGNGLRTAVLRRGAKRQHEAKRKSAPNAHHFSNKTECYWTAKNRNSLQADTGQTPNMRGPEYTTAEALARSGHPTCANSKRACPCRPGVRAYLSPSQLHEQGSDRFRPA